LRKPLGRLAVAVLASIAIPLAIAPIASAAAPALATSSSSVSSFKDNIATGVDLPDGKGLLRIASSNGKPSNITSKDFDVIDTYQAEEDGRYWDVTVKMKDNKSFKKDKLSASWHCPGHEPKPTSTSQKPPKSTESTSKSHPSKTTTPPTKEKPTPTSAPTSSSPVATAPTEVTTTPGNGGGGGDVVNCPVTPSAPAGGSTPQVPFTPVGGVETGYGFLAS
jgi:hypothetical protein